MKKWRTRNGNMCSKCSMCSRTSGIHFFRTQITRMNAKIAHFIGNYDAFVCFLYVTKRASTKTVK